MSPCDAGPASRTVSAEDARILDRPGCSSALGDGRRIYGWTDTETERYFVEAARDWSQRQRE